VQFMTIKESLSPQSNNITLLRLILASFVIIGHTYAINPTNQQIIYEIQNIAPFEYTGSFAVKIFFFFSGLLIVNSLYQHQNTIHYWSHRMMRIFPGLFLVLFVSAFIIGPLFTSLNYDLYFVNKEVYKYLEKNIIFNTRYYLPGVFITNAYPKVVNGSLWSLFWEFKCYIITYIVYLISFKKYFKWVGTFFFMILCIQILFFNQLVFSELTTEPYYPFYFFFGGILALHSDRVKLNLSLFGITFILMVSGYFLPLPYNSLFFLVFWCLFFLWLTTTKLLKKLSLKNDVSYGVYLWGFVIQQSLYKLFPHLGMYEHMLIALVISILLGAFSWFIVEKPAMNIAKKISNLVFSRNFPF